MKFMRKHGAVLAMVAAFAMWTGLCCLVTAINVKSKTKREVSEELRIKYEAELQDYKNKVEAEKLVPEDIMLAQQMDYEAELISKILYGVKNNKIDDLKTYCWCIFNRVDSRAYPSTIEEVVSQPNQWMAYSENNPILDELFLVAREQVETWHNGHRPVSPEFVYTYWTPNEITLRDNWKDGSTTHYWRYQSSK